jgi:hypothetical protein
VVVVYQRLEFLIYIQHLFSFPFSPLVELDKEIAKLVQNAGLIFYEMQN